MGDSDGFRLDDLSGLKDVSLSGIADGNILVYVAATRTWQNRATLPATAGVDSVTNTDGTLVISPTTGAVVSGINLTQANIWTGLITANGGIQQLNGGNAAWTLQGNALNTSILIQDTATGGGIFNLGLASGVAYFSNALLGDAIVRSRVGRLLMGYSPFSPLAPATLILDTSGNATITGLMTASGGMARPKISHAELATAYTSSSAVPVSTGFGISVVATSTGKILLETVGRIANNTLADSTYIRLYQSTVGIPASGASPGGTDTLITAWGIAQEGEVSNFHQIAGKNLSTGLTAGTTYYFYLSINVNGGTGTLLDSAGDTTLTAEAV